MTRPPRGRYTVRMAPLPPPIPPAGWKIRVPLEPGRDYEVLALHLCLRSRWLIPRCIWHGIRVDRLAARAPGLVADAHPYRPSTAEFWHLTVWASMRDLMAFVHAPPHADAMRVMLPLLAAGSVGRMPIRGAAWPLPPDAFARLLAGGRPLVLPPAP